MPHIHELIDFVVDVLIIHKNKVLLVFHKQSKKWLPIGEHIELDENPEEALLREVKEECGLEIEIMGNKPRIKSKGTQFLYAPVFLDIHDITDNHKHIGLYYFVRAKSEKFIFNQKEHDDIRWFNKKELEDPKFNLSSAVKFYAKEALNRAKLWS